MDLMETIRKRRAYRALVKTEITDEMIERLGEAARLSPSAMNMQPWRFVFATDPVVMKQVLAALPGYNQWAKNASMFIAVCSSEKMDSIVHEDTDVRKYVAHPSEFGESPDRPMCLYDVGIASGFIMLAATTLGLVAHPIAGYMESGVKKALHVPDDLMVCAMMIVGKRTEDPAVIAELPADLQKDEVKRPARLDLDRFVFRNRYGG